MYPDPVAGAALAPPPRPNGNARASRLPPPVLFRLSSAAAAALARGTCEAPRRDGARLRQEARPLHPELQRRQRGLSELRLSAPPQSVREFATRPNVCLVQQGPALVGAPSCLPATAAVTSWPPAMTFADPRPSLSSSSFSTSVWSTPTSSERWTSIVSCVSLPCVALSATVLGYCASSGPRPSAHAHDLA